VINDPEGGVLNLTSGSNTYSGWAANTDGTITSTVDPACTPSVNAKVTIAANKDRVRKGHKIKVTGTATPAKAGVMLSLQEKSGGAWSTVSSNTLTASGAFKFVEKAKGGHHPVKRFRVVIGTGTLYAGGTSNVVKVLVIR
jgi:hypothetical protein